MQPAVFLDKDGTLINDVPYNADPDLITLADGVLSGVSRLYLARFALVVVTNQAGIAKGYFSEQDLSAVRNKLQALIKVPLSGFYYCPHHPQGSLPEYTQACDCRKPAPGLLLRAAADLDLDLNRSWMVGDILNDIEAGCLAGCRTVLIDNGNETEWNLTQNRTPNIRAANFAQAVDPILYATHYEKFSYTHTL